MYSKMRNGRDNPLRRGLGNCKGASKPESDYRCSQALQAPRGLAGGEGLDIVHLHQAFPNIVTPVQFADML